MTNETFFLGMPQSFKNICKIYPPKIKELLEEDGIGFSYITLLTMTQEEIYDLYEIEREDPSFRLPTPFEFILLNSHQNEEIKTRYEKAFYFFLKEKVAILSDLQVILIGVEEDNIDPDKDLLDPRVLDKNNFFDFQNFIRQAVGKKEVTEVEDFNNELPQVAKIKALGRKRDKLAAKKKSGNCISFGTSLAALCCMGAGINPLNLGEMSLVAVESIRNLYEQKEKYDIDMHFIYAGANQKEVKPKYWIYEEKDN